MDRLRLALVGAAGLVAAPAHLQALAALADVELTCLCDPNVEALAQLAASHSVGKTCQTFDRVLDDPDIDAVDLVVPPALHAEMAIAAAQSGKHVYVEKPMAHTVGQGKAMIAAAADNDVTLMVGESYWFHSPHAKAAELVAEGEVGDVLQIRQTKGPWLFTPQEDERLGGQGHHVAWRLDPEESGGGPFPWMMDHGCHLFATARRLSGFSRIEQVSAIARQADTSSGGRNLRQITALTFTFAGDAADGVWTQTETEEDAGPYIGFRTEIIGTRGSILVFGEGGGAAPSYPEIAPVTLLQGGDMISFDIDDEPPDRAWQSNNNYYDYAHRHTLAEFARSCLDKRPPTYSPEDGLHDLSATLATIRSASDGCTVSVANMADDWRPPVAP